MNVTTRSMRRQQATKARRERLLELFRRHHRQHGSAPTVRWLSARLGVTPGIVQRDLQRLAAEGRLLVVGGPGEARRYALPGHLVLAIGDTVRVRLLYGAEVHAQLLGTPHDTAVHG